MKKMLSRAAVIGFWLVLWQFAAVRVNNRILLAGPTDVCGRIFEELGQIEFYAAAAGSLVRIMAGFLLGMILGAAIGACAFFCHILRRFLEPVILTMKSVPIAAFVILVLIWSGSEYLAVPVSFLVVFPYFYVQTMSGLAGADRDRLAFARVCGMRGINRALYVYRPALAPYLLGAARVTIGMSFKSGIAAEVIGIPEFAIGTKLYLSKVYLDTEGVLAWTVVIVLLSFFCEKGILLLLGALMKLRIPPVSGRKKSSAAANAWQDAQGVAIPAMSKTYQGKTAVSLPKIKAPKGARIAIVGESGSGKTTWLNMLMGLTSPDDDTAESLRGGRTVQISPVFQEDCLFLSETAADNVRMVCAEENTGRIGECLERLLPAGASRQPAAELSGGMMRRTAAARAMLAGGSLLVLDEPFGGLDEENRKRLAAFILEYQGDRPLIFTAHDMAEAALLCPDEIVRIALEGTVCVSDE